MALMSPRFKTSSKLVAASNGAVIRKGARGRHVHLIQMTLIDLGYLMPRSIGGVFSPDGVYGDETKQKVAEFQRANNLTPDGEIGRNTMTVLDRICRNYKYIVTLHFRSISLTTVSFSDTYNSTENVYGQYGIKIAFGSGESLMMSNEKEQQFNQVDESCRWEIDDGEVNQLHSTGSPFPSNHIGVYYVKSFSNNSLLGCGGHAKNRPACTVAAAASRWDTAHEVGHVLLTSSFNPVHVSEHQRNLMYPYSRNTGQIPVLTDRQVAQIRRNICCVSM